MTTNSGDARFQGPNGEKTLTFRKTWGLTCVLRNAQNPPSDLTLLGYISLIRERITERVPGIMNPSGPGPIMRPLEAALVAYVLMTADNGWIYPQRARLYLTADEIRSFLGDLGIKFQRQNRYLPPNGQPLPR